MEEHVKIGQHQENTISPNGAPETKNPECGGVNYWFHSGNIFTTQAAWTITITNLRRKLVLLKDPKINFRLFG